MLSSYGIAMIRRIRQTQYEKMLETGLPSDEDVHSSLQITEQVLRGQPVHYRCSLAVHPEVAMMRCPIKRVPSCMY